jgi:pyridoxal phosphate enzyme (YggS family)
MDERRGRDEAAARLAAVQERIAQAAREAGRDPAEVTLIAVSKTVPAAAILPVIEAGQLVFGENRVQEAKAKWPDLRARHPAVKLHLVGPLQSNKVKDAVALADAIHTIDREKIAGMIAEEQARAGRALELFVEVNTGGEAQKAGVDPLKAAAFVARCREEFGLTIAGLMCIPPLDDQPAPHFALLAKIAGEAGVAGLSMGMSADFEIAIAHGATHVRVGTAIFGERR